MPYDIYFANKNCTANNHSNRYDRYVHLWEINVPNPTYLTGKYSLPQKTSQGCADCCTERSIVDSNCQAIYRSPECSIADREPVTLANLFPCLN